VGSVHQATIGACVAKFLQCRARLIIAMGGQVLRMACRCI